MSDKLVDEFGSLFHVALPLILQVAKLILKADNFITGSLRVKLGLFSQVFHRGKVLSPPLVLELVDSKLYLSGCVLFKFHKLCVHVLLIRFL